jgi:hypothetical protein
LAAKRTPGNEHMGHRKAEEEVPLALHSSVAPRQEGEEATMIQICRGRTPGISKGTGAASSVLLEGIPSSDRHR